MDAQKEIWKDIAGYEGVYQVSNIGRVKKLKSKKYNYLTKRYNYYNEFILKQSLSVYGYYVLSLSNNGKRKYHTVGRLVAIAFIPNPKNKPQVNHKDEIKTNNNVENLDWMTAKENSNHGTRTKRIVMKNIRGKSSKKVVQLSLDNEVVKIWESAKEAGKHGFNKTAISGCCNNKVNIHKKHKWQFYGNV